METKKFVSHEIPVTQVHIQSERAAKLLGKRCGLYITLETGPLHQLVLFENVCACLAEQLRPLLKPYYGKSLCVCGLGNSDVPYDALGPETAKRFRPEAYDSFSLQSNFERVAVICPGVRALTNLSSETIISSVASGMGAACLLIIDASACSDVERLCSTIQLSNSGMQTYWRMADLSHSTLGIPVISIVVPTVIRATDLSVEKNVDPELLRAPLSVLDSVNVASFAIACAVTQVVYPELDFESCQRYIEFFLHGV